MTEYNYNKMIAKAIIAAQTASDSGKWLDRQIMSGHNNRAPQNQGYSVKTAFIVRALSLIDGRKTDFRYYVTGMVPDQNGYASVLVYFQFRNDAGKKYQISFHTPQSEWKALHHWCGKGTPMRWDRKVSFASCHELAKKYNLF
jgi:hypothetical protein